jgi:carbonic anhydrase
MALSRRDLLIGCSAAAGLASFAPLERAVAATPTLSHPSDPLRGCIPSDPLKELLQGNQRFAAVWSQAEAASSRSEKTRILSSLWDDNCHTDASVLKDNQAPWAAILTCADSRVAPEWIFNASLNELFVIRSAGNTAFDDAVASLEYGVAVLGIPLIVVMGHSNCGAVKAAMTGQLPTPLLIELAKPIQASLPAHATLKGATEANSSYAARALTQRSTLLREAQAKGTLMIKAAYLDVASGRVTML